MLGEVLPCSSAREHVRVRVRFRVTERVKVRVRVRVRDSRDIGPADHALL